MRVLGIPGYDPQLHSSMSSLLDAAGDDLLSLLGLRLDAIWLAWSLDEDAWWEALPVVLQLEQTQFEFCAWELNKLTVSLNLIDLAAPINYLNLQELHLAWRVNPLAEFQPLIGQRLHSITALEVYYRVQAGVVDRSGANPDAWIPYGLELQFDAANLTLFNNLDRNGMTTGSAEFDQMLRRAAIRGGAP